MANYSSILRLSLQVAGENPATWGLVANAGVFQLMEDAVAGKASIATTGGTTTLTTNNGATDQARMAVLDVSGTLVSNATIVVPTKSKMYLVRNGTTGGSFTVTVKMAAGNVAVVPRTAIQFVYADETTGVYLLPGGPATLGSVTTGAITATGLVVDTTTLVVDEANNRVGVGTASPAYTLHVNGVFYGTQGFVAEGTETNPSFRLGQNANHAFLNYISSGVKSLAMYLTEWDATKPILSINAAGQAYVGDLGGSPAEDLFDVPGAFLLARRKPVQALNVAKAIARRSGSAVAGFNVSSITVNAVGDYTINFTENITSGGGNEPMAVVTPTNLVVPTIFSISDSAIRIKFFNFSSALAEPGIFNVVVFDNDTLDLT